MQSQQIQRRGSKPVVYLDQNWLSDLTKAHQGTGRNSDRPYFLKLSSLIQQGVANDRFANPMSMFHKSEGSLSSRLDTSIRSVNNTLSRGLIFNSSNHISHEKLKVAALNFAGLDIPPVPWWQIPFNRDPDTPDCALPPAKSDGLEVYFTISELIEEQRCSRNVAASQYRDYKEVRKEAGESYQREIEFSKLQLVCERYDPLFQLKAVEDLNIIDPGWRAIYQMAALQNTQSWSEIERIINQNRDPQSFWDSPEFADIPFHTIRATLMSADIIRYPDSKPEASLQDDFSIVATILPYSDAFATENYIAELIKQTKMSEKYSCRVFTMREKEEFLTYLEEL